MEFLPSVAAAAAAAASYEKLHSQHQNSIITT